MNDIISPFDRPLTLISVYNIVYFTFNILGFGLVAGLQFISARVDPSRMGALQGALTACALIGGVLGQFSFTALFVMDEIPKNIIFVIGSIVSGCGTLLVFYLRATFHSEI